MPIYELQCKKCKKVGEYLVFGPIDEEECKYCGKKDFERLMSVFAYKSDGKIKATGNDGCRSCTRGSCSSCL